MLLEYNQDTVDEKMVPSAIEIRRRVASRKLAKSLEDGIMNADDLLLAKEMNRDEKKEHTHEQFTITMAGVHSRISVARAEQQLTVHHKVRALEKDVARASRLGKSRMDALSDLESRIQNMRAQLQQPIIPPPDVIISRELRASNKGTLEKQFDQCPKCSRRILVELLETHKRMCQHKNISDHTGYNEEIPIYDVHQDLVTSIVTFAPQMPRNCQVVSKGATFIQWEWEPPVIDGGLTVTDYEISYLVKISEFDKATGKYKKSEIEVPSLRTSLWCFAENPVCNHGYRMTGLRAGTEYTDFKLRCYNLRGWSPWVDMIPRSSGDNSSSTTSDATDWKARLEAEDEARNVDTSKLLVVGRSVFTNPPEPPSGPLFVTVTQVTSSCIHFNWQAPWYDGGSEITDYVIRYTELEKQLTVTERDVIVIHQRSFKTHSGTATSAVIRNIFSDIDVINLSIEAVNKAGLNGEKIPITYKGEKIIHTEKASRFVQLNREMARAQQCKDAFIDSAFFTGVRQRLLKVDFMHQLAEELSVTSQDETEMEEAKQWAAVLYKQQVKMEARAEAQRLAEQASVVENDSIEYNEDGTVISTRDNFDFTYKQRRRHFRVKIASLENLTRDLTNERKNLDKERCDCTLSMKAKEKVLLSYKLEYERLKHYTGVSVTSSVLTGSNMQYLVTDYREKIDRAFDQVISEIGKLKFKVINNETRKQRIKQLLIDAENLKKDRQAKFLEFENNYQKSLLAMERLNLNAPNFIKLMRKYFVELKNYKLKRQAKRDQVTQLFNHVIFRYKRSAFSKWKMGEFHFDSSDTNKFISVGSILLQQSCEKRIELQGLLRGLVAETATIKQNLTLAKMSRDTKKKLTSGVNFKLMDEGLDHRDLHSTKGMHFLYEGDGYAMENKFVLAQHNYEAQIWYLRAQPRGVDIKMLAICHGRLGKMFLQLGKTNRAIVEFDRQLSLAREISDKAEEADGYYGLGSGYLDSYDYENAARYLIIASTMFEALDNGPKFCGALIQLKDCFGRLGKQDKVEMYTTKIEAIENDLKNKLKFMNTRLEDFRVRLTSTAAEIEHVIHIERMTVKALGIKRSIEDQHDHLKELEGQVKAQEDKIAGIEALLDAIAAELSEAIETDEPEMMSHLVHDQPQVIEVEELKVRLAAKSAQQVEHLQTERVELKRLNVLVSNCENTIREYDQQLTLENGALMKHSQLDKPFRFIGLCQSNTAGNEVTGTATGGFEEFAAAEGCNIHMIDYHSGALNHIFAGEVKNKLDPVGHTAVVTVLCHDGALLYSGSADELIICWNTITKQKVMVLRGHEGTIVAIAVETNMVVSSAADATLRLWDKHTGQQMRVLFGHSKSVISMEIGPTWLLTGSADHEVRLWKVFSKNKHHMNAECSFRLIGHECIVTCVRYGKLEIVSGDEKGRIFIWWVATGQILRKCSVHKGPVKCMQFDTVHIVSGGVDNTVAITDIATGEVLQSLHGHTGHVLALAFDTERILSASGDNTVRYWQWGKKADTSDKYHVFDKGETLAGVSKLYGLDIDTLMLWNGIAETKQCYVGMKLLVRKGDPDVMTDAEKAAAAREKRRLATMTLVDQKLRNTKQSLLGGEHTMQYDRVHKLATDIDFYSLGNRLFGREKRQNELFPDAFDINANSNSLAARISRANALSGQETYGIEMRQDIKASKLQARYYINADNEDEWGEVSDALGVTMLAMMIEYTAYEVVMEQKRMLRSNQSVVGRTNAYQKKLAAQKEAEAAEAAAAAIAVGTQLQLLHGESAVAAAEGSSVEEGKETESRGLKVRGDAIIEGDNEDESGGEGASSKSSSPSKKQKSKSKKEKSSGGGKSRKSTKNSSGSEQQPLSAVQEDASAEESPSATAATATAQDDKLPPVKSASAAAEDAVVPSSTTSSKKSSKPSVTTLPPI